VVSGPVGDGKTCEEVMGTADRTETRLCEGHSSYDCKDCVLTKKTSSDCTHSCGSGGKQPWTQVQTQRQHNGGKSCRQVYGSSMANELKGENSCDKGDCGYWKHWGRKINYNPDIKSIDWHAPPTLSEFNRRTLKFNDRV
jgi:hypothetical protein